ncbi:MAG: AAA family ATPase, partial [Gammaproteobacteria bacterium]
MSRLAADLAATGAACETRSTHISLILLTPDHAYKFKRPVDFGFVDFSTLERRRHFCEREVELNRRFAPALYEGVVPVTGSAAAPRLGGDGAAIEFAVSMRRFDEARIFAAALDRGALDAAHFRAFGRRLAALHAAAPAAGIASDFGSAD